MLLPQLSSMLYRHGRRLKSNYQEDRKWLSDSRASIKTAADALKLRVQGFYSEEEVTLDGGSPKRPSQHIVSMI